MRRARTVRLPLIAAAIVALAPLSSHDGVAKHAAIVRIPDLYQDAYLSNVFDWRGVTRNPGNGLPMVRSPGLTRPQWNYVTIALYGLQRWSAWVHHRDGAAARARAIEAADFLVARQGRDGAWRYRYGFTYVHGHISERIAPGWVAAQAQGNAISFLIRMYAATGRWRYIASAVRALRPFTRPVAAGGLVVDFDGHRLLAGFPTARPSLTLEDFELALIGVADLAPYSAQAQVMLNGLLANFFWSLPLYTSPDGRPYFDLVQLFARTHGVTDKSAAAFCVIGLRTLLAGYRSPRGETALARWTAALAEWPSPTPRSPD